MKIQISKTIYLTGSTHSYSLSKMVSNHLKEFRWFGNNLEGCFKHFLHYKIRSSQAVEFSELVLVVVEAIREIKKCCKELKEYDRTKLQSSPSS